MAKQREVYKGLGDSGKFNKDETQVDRNSKLISFRDEEKKENIRNYIADNIRISETMRHVMENFEME